MAKKEEVQVVTQELKAVGERAARVKILEESISAMEERIKAERKMLYAEMVNEGVTSFRLDDGTLIMRTKQGEDKHYYELDEEALSQVIDLEQFKIPKVKPGVVGHIRIKYSDDVKALNHDLKVALDQEIAAFYRKLTGE